MLMLLCFNNGMLTVCMEQFYARNPIGIGVKQVNVGFNMEFLVIYGHLGEGRDHGIELGLNQSLDMCGRHDT